MVLYLEGNQRRVQADLFARLFKVRHDVFVKGRQWSLPSRGNSDIDQYDCQDAVYFCELGDTGTVEAHVRLTPTVTHSLLADIFPHLVEGDLEPRGDRIFEATRYIVRPSKRGGQENRAAKARLLVGMLDWALDHELSYIQTVIDTATFATFVEMTSETIPLGLSHPFGGGPNVPGGGDCMAIRWPVTEKVRADLVAYGALQIDRRRSRQPMLTKPAAA